MKHLALRRLSYSSLLTFHKCPRLFYLERHELNKDIKSIHLSYGKAIGSGMQEVMKGSSLQDAWFAAFLAWDIDIEEEEEKSKKSLWFALLMTTKFAEEIWPHMQRLGWELYYHDEQATDEFSWKIHFFDDFHLVGFIDAILINKRTNEIKVMEIKTTKYKSVDEALYANSWQGLGYSVILDALGEQEDLFASFEVLYEVVKSTDMSFESLPFKKDRGSKAIWLKDITNNIEQIQRYEEEDYWPQHGEACWDYAAYRSCRFFGACHMSLKGLFLKDAEVFNKLAAAKVTKETEAGTYKLEMALNSIIENQLRGLT